MTALIDKYRPTRFDAVVGHDAVVQALQLALKKGLARAFLFTGPSGVGKTTLAYIMANELGCLPGDLVDIDAATNTGIEDMRNVTSGLMYRPIGAGTIKAVIVDEAHALSKAAIQSLLKILEKPPDWVYWFLCTTEANRILPTVKTRCVHCDLRPVTSRKLIELLSFISEEEKFKTDSDILVLCAEAAGGSPRQAISNLALCASATVDDARKLLRSAGESAEAIQLARALMKRAGWKEIQSLLARLKEDNPESVRHIIRAYMTTVVLNAKTEQAAGGALEILDVFSQPFHSSDGVSPLVMACGKICLGGE